MKSKKLLISVLLGLSFLTTSAFANNLYALGFRLYIQKVYLKTHHRLYPVLEKMENGDYSNIDIEDGDDLVKFLSTEKGREAFKEILTKNGDGDDAKYIIQLLTHSNPRVRQAILAFLKKLANGYIPPSCG